MIPQTIGQANEEARKEGLTWFMHPDEPGRLLPIDCGTIGIPPYERRCWHGEFLTNECEACGDDLAALLPAQREAS